MKYRVHAFATIEMFTKIEADTEEEARDIACQRSIVRLLSDGNPDDEWVTSGELDGEPEVDDVEEI